MHIHTLTHIDTYSHTLLHTGTHSHAYTHTHTLKYTQTHISYIVSHTHIHTHTHFYPVLAHTWGPLCDYGAGNVLWKPFPLRSPPHWCYQLCCSCEPRGCWATSGVTGSHGSVSGLKFWDTTAQPRTTKCGCPGGLHLSVGFMASFYVALW